MGAFELCGCLLVIDGAFGLCGFDTIPKKNILRVLKNTISRVDAIVRLDFSFSSYEY